MRIAFFGGSFDPPHAGHLSIARAAAERLHLDRLLFAPVGVQPLKLEGPPATCYRDRLNMLRLLLEDSCEDCGDAGMIVSELDAPLANHQPNYTYDTLLALRARLEANDKLFVLLGADSFLSMRQWRHAPELLLLADWIVASRPGFSLQQLDQALPSSIGPSGAAKQHDGFISQQLAGADGRSTHLYLLPDLHEEVSATAIRAVLAAGPNTRTSTLDPADPGERPVLSPSVVAYIRSRGLYQVSRVSDAS
jgi:nicotinate-nucleotide adenylyltransferase